MNNRGISTLVTVVLVVSLGVLATIVGFSFADILFEKAYSSAERKAGQDTVCIQEVVIDLQKGCYLDEDNLKFYVANNGMRNIDGFIVRLYSKDSKVNLDQHATGLTKFMVSNVDAQWKNNANLIKMIEVLPKINYNDKVVVCSNAKKSFGNLNSPETIPKCA